MAAKDDPNPARNPNPPTEARNIPAFTLYDIVKLVGEASFVSAGGSGKTAIYMKTMKTEEPGITTYSNF